MGSLYLNLFLFVLFGCVTIKCEQDYVTNLASKCNYNVEVHRNIQTEDGYLLTMHRLIPSRKEKEFKIRTPVLMMHGLFGSAEHFILLDCQSSLAYLLLEEGYDVWLGNVRSVSYSRNHVSLDPNGLEYWNITLDDYGSYDLPRLIDYILETTDHRQIMYVGHSQGTMIMYIMASNRPEYADKMKLFINLSPVATLNNFPHPWLPTVCRHINKVEAALNMLGLYEWTIGRDYIRKYGEYMCGGILSYICKYVIYLFSGMKAYKLHNEDMKRLLTNGPEGISARQFMHASQMHYQQEFTKFDYGSIEINMEKYGSITPPKYDLSKMTIAAALYYSDDDWFLDSKQVPNIAAQLPNVVDIYKISLKDFSHLDFVVGRDAPKILYPRIIRLMNKRNYEDNFTPKETNMRYINQTGMLNFDINHRKEYRSVMESVLNSVKRNMLVKIDSN